MDELFAEAVGKYHAQDYDFKPILMKGAKGLGNLVKSLVPGSNYMQSKKNKNFSEFKPWHASIFDIGYILANYVNFEMMSQYDKIDFEAIFIIPAVAATLMKSYTYLKDKKEIKKNKEMIRNEENYKMMKNNIYIQ